MAKYRQYPNCGNSAAGTSIYQCTKGGRVFCAACGEMSTLDWLNMGITEALGLGGDKCPFCKTEKVHRLGGIE